MSLAGARFLLLLEPGLEGGPIRAALPPTAPVHVAELAEGLARASQLLDDSTPDLILVGCSSHSEPALGVIRDFVARRADCPVVVLYQGNPNEIGRAHV